jgi:hypothetical protein
LALTQEERRDAAAKAVRATPRAGLSPEDDRELRAFIETPDEIVKR